MKICIPTGTDQGKAAEVFEHFGSAPYFTLVHTQSGNVEVIDNTNQHHEHGMCHPMSALDGKEVDAVVTGGMGARAIQKLNQSGIKVFRAVPGTVQALLEQFAQGNMEELTVSNACQHHGCH